MMAAIDEVVFHQLLAWHHFFDWGTPAFSLLSDGLLHSAELILFVLGFFMFSRLYRRGALNRTAAWAGFVVGMGGFQQSFFGHLTRMWPPAHFTGRSCLRPPPCSRNAR